MQTDYVLHSIKGIKESLDNGTANSLIKYKDSRIFMFETTSEFDEIFTSTEGLTGSKELTETETPPTLSLEEGYSVTLSDKRIGGAISVTEHDQVRMKDNTTLIDKFIQRQRNRLIINNTGVFLRGIFELLNDAFAGALHIAPDGEPLCSNQHEWKSGGNFDNRSTAVLSVEAVDAVQEYGGAFVDPSGEVMPLDFDTIIVKKGSANSVIAKKLFAASITPTQVADINIYEGVYKIIETPYITGANKAFWFMTCSNMESPLYVGINVFPKMNEPIRDKNESVYASVTGFFKRGINNMPFAIYGSTGEGSGS